MILPGALDAGVQLAVRGAKTAVITDAAADWSESARNLDVLVVDAETRHLPAAQAYEIVFRIVTLAARLQVPYIYKKTDSALRGNVGAELSAVLHASGETQLPFLPAFPQIGRCTVKGVHYIQGVPVDQSVFGKDPFEPVKQSRVDQLVASQTQDPVISLPALTAGAQTPEQKGILVFDAGKRGRPVRHRPCPAKGGGGCGSWPAAPDSLPCFPSCWTAAGESGISPCPGCTNGC